MSIGGRSRLLKYLAIVMTVFVVAAVTIAVWMSREEPPEVIDEGFSIEGVVIDRLTMQPVADATLNVAEQTVVADEGGRFELEGIRAGQSLQVGRDGYHPLIMNLEADREIQAILEPYRLDGVVVEAETGVLVEGAKVTVGDETQVVGADGTFGFLMIQPGSQVRVEAEGYHPAQFFFDLASQSTVELRPVVVAVEVINAWTAEPIVGASVEFDGREQTTGDDGVTNLERIVPGSTLTVRAPDFAVEQSVFTGETDLRISLRPTVVTGRVAGPDDQPIAGATVLADELEIITDAEGRFVLRDAGPKTTLQVSVQGYKPLEIETDQQSHVDIALEPIPVVRSIYLTYYGVGSDALLQNALDLVEETEVNAIVIDVKGDRGWLAYRSDVPMVAEIGAQQQIMIPDVEEFVSDMKDRGIYLIARIVVFKDHPLAQSRPDLAVQDSEAGGLWIDLEGLAWTDPFKEEVWDYNIAIAREAAQHGFDEIQFDYIRFPTDAGPGTSVHAISVSQPNNMTNRVNAISGFLQRAREELNPYGVRISVDVFGYVCWRDDDMGIGQHLETMAQYVDVISPMIYPTLYWHGLPVTEGPKYETDAAAHPYEIVYLSLKRANERLMAAGASAKLRPWLQYFHDYISGIPYGAREIELQKQATYDNDITGWLFWDPTNWFSKGGFEPVEQPQ